MQTEIQKAFTTASKRLLLLDYDGTLREFELQPDMAVPTPEIKDLLTGLGSLEGTRVVLISGRPRQVMELWFGGLPVCLVAEHGFYYKLRGGKWQAALDLDESWKPAVREVFERYSAQVPLSTIEEKGSALAWHYRASDSAVAEPRALQACKVLAALAEELPISIVPGHQVIEVHLRGVDKGTAAQRFLEEPYGFMLAAGDDTTDEDLLKAMPERAFTVKVGPGESTARVRLNDPSALRTLLHTFLQK